MNCLNIVQQFENVTTAKLCENERDQFLKFDDFFELQEYISNHGYDIPKLSFDAKVCNVIEEVTVDEDNVTLLCDDTEVSFETVEFFIRVFCNEDSVINIKDQGNYCEKCYNLIAKKYNFPKLETVKTALKEHKENPFKGLSVSKKIQYILSLELGTKMSSSQIYQKGIPWEVAGKTPKNTIAARCSTLCQNGFIKKKDTMYFI